MEEKHKKNIIKWSILFFAMLFVIPVISVLTFKLLGKLCDLYPPLIFIFAGGSLVIVGFYVAFVVWFKRKKYNIKLKVAVFLMTLTVLLSFLYYTFLLFWFMITVHI
jgi:hypothetical protein